MSLLLLMAGAYLVGSIPFGLLVGRWLRGVDIRQHGSGNIGFTNVLRILGPGPAVLVLVADVGKGLVPVAVGQRMLGPSHPAGIEWWVLGAGLAAILGHSFSVFCGFRGGRAVATSFGVLLGLCWPAAAVALGVWGLVVATTRYVSLGSIIGSLSVPCYLALTRRPPSWVAFWAAISALIVARHIPNLRRLLAGTESRLGQRAATAPESSDGDERP